MNDTPLVIDATQVGELCGLPRLSVLALNRKRKMPKPANLPGRRFVWHRWQIELWRSWDFPTRRVFDRLLAEQTDRQRDGAIATV